MHVYSYVIISYSPGCSQTQHVYVPIIGSQWLSQHREPPHEWQQASVYALSAVAMALSIDRVCTDLPVV